MKHLLFLLSFIFFVPQSNAGGPLIWGSEGSAKALQSGGIWMKDGAVLENDGTTNYVKNNKAEIDADGWATYADVAGTDPVDGTGGSPTVTFARNTTTPLAGGADFKFVKDASNRQGEGFSYDFTIDQAYENNQITIKTTLDATDANFSPGDVSAFVYDVTNTTVLTTAVPDVAGAKYVFHTTFNATDSTSYRLIFHVTSTNATAYTLYFDNFEVSAGVQVQGVPQTDWAEVTGSSLPSDGWFTGTNTMYYRRDGDTMHVRSNYAMTSSVSTTINPGIPFGLTLDTTKIEGSNATFGRDSLGSAFAADTGTGRFTGLVQYKSGSGGLIIAGSAGNIWSATVPHTWANTDEMVLRYTIPIAEWAGSSVNLNVAVAEYASNSDTSDAADTTSFAYGPAGQEAAYTFGANREKTVRFLTPIQPTDKIELQMSEDREDWHQVPFISSANATYNHLSSTTGVMVKNSNSNNTDVIVLWGRYRASTTHWSAATAYWRVVKYPGVIHTATVNAVRWQTKGPVSEAATSTDVTGVKFTGLTAGKTYKASIRAEITNSGSSATEQFLVRLNHDSSIICTIGSRGDAGSADTKGGFMGAEVIFLATTTELITSTLETGSGAAGDIYVTVEELPTHVNVSEW